MTPVPWPAPLATVPVDATIRLPGSKSITNRALVLAALAHGPSRLCSPLEARDTRLMAAGLRVLGVEVSTDADTWSITPGPLRGPGVIDVGLAGTVMRFLPPLATLACGPVRFDGDRRARERPLGGLLSSLREFGADLDVADGAGLPFTVQGRGRLRGGSVTFDASASSQLVSGLLLVGARTDTGVTVRHAGGRLPSAPHIAMTVAMLRERGVVVDEPGPDTWRVEPGPVAPLDVIVEPDLSNAAPFLAAALATNGRVTVSGWPEHTTQPGAALADLLAQMGATVHQDAAGLTVRGGGRITAIDADLGDESELVPVLAVLAALAAGTSRIRGIAHMRGHETDRLAALARELSALGAHVEESPDGLTIRPGPLHGGVFASYDDHRLATAAAVLGLVVPGVGVGDVSATDKTLPGFVGRWQELLEQAPSG